MLLLAGEWNRCLCPDVMRLWLMGHSAPSGERGEKCGESSMTNGPRGIKGGATAEAVGDLPELHTEGWHQMCRMPESLPKPEAHPSPPPLSATWDGRHSLLPLSEQQPILQTLLVMPQNSFRLVVPAIIYLRSCVCWTLRTWIIKDLHFMICIMGADTR